MSWLRHMTSPGLALEPRVTEGQKVPQNYMGSAWDAVLDPRQSWCPVFLDGEEVVFRHEMKFQHTVWLEWNFEWGVYFGQTVLANVLQV